MLQKDKWPFVPVHLSGIVDKETLAVIESGCSERLGRVLTILDYVPETRSFSHRIESINLKQRWQGFCRLLRDENRVQGGDEACKKCNIKGAKISLQEFRKTGEPFRTFKCHMGLQEVTYIVRIRNRPVALLYSGQYRPPGGIDEIRENVRVLGSGRYAHIYLDDATRRQLLSLAEDLRPAPVDLRDRMRREVEHIQRITKAEYQQKKHQCEQGFLDRLRCPALDLDDDEAVSLKQVRRRVHSLLESIQTFCRCKYVVFFASVQESDTVLALIAGAGIPIVMENDLPHFNWKKAGLSIENFNAKTWDITKGFQRAQTKGIRGDNSEYFASASCVLPTSLGNRYRGVLALGPFAEAGDLEQEQRFLGEIANIISTFTLTVLEVLYLGRERHRWKTAAQLLTHQFRTGLTPICNKIGRAMSLLSSEHSPPDMKRLKGFLGSAEDFAINLRKGAKETLASHVLQIEPDDLEFERHQLSVLVTNCATGYMGEARKNSRTLIVDPSIESLPQTDVDIGRLTIALGNLIENAIKYSYPNTEITIRSHLDLLDTSTQSALAVAVIEVHDIGLPIPTREQEAIFEEGTRGLTAAKMGHISGSGLGLWEARAVIEAHSAKINVRCNPISAHHGNRRAYHVVFSIRIPIEG